MLGRQVARKHPPCSRRINSLWCCLWSQLKQTSHRSELTPFDLYYVRCYSIEEEMLRSSTLPGVVTMSSTNIRAVVFQDRGLWIAQCLEHDLCTSARTYKELVTKLASQVRLQIHMDRKRGKEPLEDLPKAPNKFWKMYSDSAEGEEILIRGSWLDSIMSTWKRPREEARLTLVTA